MERRDLSDFLQGSGVDMSFRDLPHIPSLRKVCERVEIYGRSVSRLVVSTGEYFFCPDYKRHDLRLIFGRFPNSSVSLTFPGRFCEESSGILYQMVGERQRKTDDGRLVFNLRNLECLTVAHYVGDTNYLINIRRQ